jgi:transposase
VVFETTEVYYLDLAATLFKAGWPVAVINPKNFHHFAKLSHGKTDGSDASLLAEYGECMKPTPTRAVERLCRNVGVRKLTPTYALSAFGNAHVAQNRLKCQDRT